QEVAVGVQAPLRHPFRLFLLGRQGADGVLVQAGGKGVRLDVRDEAGRILAAELLMDLAVGGVVAGDGFDGFGGHGGLPTDQETTSTAMVRRCSSSTRGRGGRICARLTSRRASETTSLISRQLLRAPHLGAMPHWWWSWLHSVRANGPSMASTTSNSEISIDGRVSR